VVKDNADRVALAVKAARADAAAAVVAVRMLLTIHLAAVRRKN
jgi:hypothetical protein